MEQIDAETAEKLVESAVNTLAVLIRQALLNDLKVPQTLVAGGPGRPWEFDCHVDGYPAARVIVLPTSCVFISSNGRRLDIRESACFSPYYGALSLRSEMINADAAAAQLDADVLAEILIAHELVHCAMMAFIDVRVPGPATEWLTRKDLRYIHECLALRMCEKLPALTGNRISKEQVDTYLGFVEREAANSPDGQAYVLFFTRFRNVADGDLWAAATDGVDLVQQLVQGRA